MRRIVRRTVTLIVVQTWTLTAMEDVPAGESAPPADPERLSGPELASADCPAEPDAPAPAFSADK